MSAEFLITSFVVVLLPGTGVLFTMAIGLGSGFGASIAAASGCTLGILPAATAGIIGLAAVFHASAVLFQVVKYLGVLYLLHMAWSVLRDGGAMSLSEDKGSGSYLKVAINGILLNVLNPKLSLFFLAFLPQFVLADALNTTGSMVLLAGVFMAMTFIVFVMYGALASLARDYVISRPQVLLWMRRVFAGTFGILGLRLALSDR